MKNEDDVLREIIDECHDDHVGLWAVAWNVRYSCDVKDESEVKQKTLNVVRELLKSTGILVGMPASDGRNFISWESDPSASFERIKSEWDNLGREISTGDIAWFTDDSPPVTIPLYFDYDLCREFLKGFNERELDLMIDFFDGIKDSSGFYPIVTENDCHVDELIQKRARQLSQPDPYIRFYNDGLLGCSDFEGIAKRMRETILQML